jgi:hypothetical protein
MRNHEEDLEVNFRIDGKIPELWYADRGISKPVSYRIKNGSTSIKLHLEAQESVFVIFQKTALQNEGFTTEKKSNEIINLSENWKVNFTEPSGTTKHSVFNKLTSWTNSEDENIKYFSGTATYTKDFEINKSALDGNLVLELENIKDVGSVSLNGKALETLWKAPFEVDITKTVKIGKNTLEIKVTNQWDNRIIGDRALPKEKKALAYAPAFGVGQKLKESGIIGEVRIMQK